MIARTEIRREYHQPRHRFRRRGRRRLHLRRRRLLSFDQQASHFEAKAYVVLKMNVVSAQVVSCCIYDKSKQNSNTCIVRFHTFLTANQVDHLLLVKSSDLTTSIKQTNTKEQNGTTKRLATLAARRRPKPSTAKGFMPRGRHKRPATRWVTGGEETTDAAGGQSHR